MTLPINITLPVILEETRHLDEKQLYSYLRKLVYATSIQLQQTNQTVNGTYIYTASTIDTSYAFIKGSSSSGTATYTDSVITTKAVNGLIFVCFDIDWTSHTGTGDIQILTPYFASRTVGMPFAGVIESDSMTLSGGYTWLSCNILPETNTIQVYQNGSGQPIIPLTLPATGHLRGSIMYVGS